MENFAPVAGLVGGVLIGLAAAVYLLALGRIAGVSGMLETLVRPGSNGYGLAVAFLLGMPIGASIVTLALPSTFNPPLVKGSLPVLVVAGLLVGFGTRLANGCTSGHGVCGLPLFSVRSIVATGVFMAFAAATVFVVRHVI
jgi:uncharacterized membrane protein YedE/YeeE